MTTQPEPTPATPYVYTPREFTFPTETELTALFVNAGGGFEGMSAIYFYGMHKGVNWQKYMTRAFRNSNH
jgi:hypothetical protein